MRAPVILPIFGAAMKAWWDDDAPAPRCVACLLHAVCDRASPARRYRDRGYGLRRRGRPRGNRGAARSAHRPRRRARRAESSRGSEPTASGHSRDRCRQHHLRHRCHRRLPRTSGGAEYDLAGQAETGCQPPRIPDRSSALVRPGGGDRFSADGLARGDRRARGAERVAFPRFRRAFRWCGAA